MQMSLLAYNRSLVKLVESRIERFVDEYKPRYIYVYFSGGKDSSAVLAASTNCCPEKVVAVYNHIVGQTHRLNVEAVIGVVKKLGLEIRRIVPRNPENLRITLLQDPPRPGQLLYLVVRSYRYGLPYWDAVKKWGFPVPSERARNGVRWCCSEYKEKWWYMLPPNGVHRGRTVKYNVVGIKRSDSPHRAKTWRTMINIYDSKSMVTLAPLYDLSDNDVWSLLRSYDLYDIVKKQYDVMGESPNCTLCPLMPLHILEKAVTKLPTSYLEMVRDTIEKYGVRGSVSEYKVSKWIEIIDKELERRSRQ